jgi:putative membrane protein
VNLQQHAEWIKVLHIVFVTSWFAGLFYLPRIFVNLALETEPHARERLLFMAHKLYKFMNLLALPALIFGLWLWLGYGIGKGSGWLYAKLGIVLFLVGYHHGCGVLLKKFTEDRNTRSHNWYRWFNEIPVLLLVLVVILVVIKPF